MFGFIRRWWKARQFKKSRELFEFFDGATWRRVDPWRTWRTFLADPDYNVDTMSELAFAEREPELTYALNAISTSFGMCRWNEDAQTGLTDEELLTVFSDFCHYMESIKKKRGRGPTLSESMDGTSPPSSVDRRSTTNSPLHSHYSADESEPAPAALSPTA